MAEPPDQKAAPPAAPARITAERLGAVWRIGIDRPAKRNALNGALFAALGHSLRLAEADGRVNCVLLQGSESCFCAGHDTAEFQNLWPQAHSGTVAACIRAFAEQPKPLVAAVNGAAVGFGATLLLHADWVVAGEGAVFRFPFAELGIVPEAGATALLARRVGDLCARDWLFSGRPVGPQEALARGFVSSVLPDDQVQAAAAAQAELLAAKPPEALQGARRLMAAAATLSAGKAVRRELAYLNELIPAASWRTMPHP